MRIGILSRNPALYSTHRLVQAARLRGHQVSVIDTLSVAVEVGRKGDNIKVIATDTSPSTTSLTFPSKFIDLPQVEAIIPRIGASITHYGVAVVRQFEAQGVCTTATARAIAQSRDKLHSLQIMNEAGLPIPKTAVIAQPMAFFSAIQSVGGPPLVIKLIQGTQGKGVILAPNLQTASYVLDKLRGMNRQAFIQEFIAEAEGRDTRIIVVGNECVAAMERQAGEGEFRSNLHLGGTAVPILLQKATEKLAVAAAQAHGLYVAGVDLIQSERGPLLLEVNSSPGLEGIEQTTKVDVAAKIIHFLERQQRMSTGTRTSSRSAKRKRYR